MIAKTLVHQLSMVVGIALVLSSVASNALAVPVVPEISGDTLTSGIALLSGGVLLLTRYFSRG
ncbi:MAG TPA: hypothetical protein VHD36_19360 [Pirellulales bacterium]|nr:hypothetical protein [Pirellulales bacterium]